MYVKKLFVIVFIILGLNSNVKVFCNVYCWDAPSGAPATYYSGANWCQTFKANGTGVQVVQCNDSPISEYTCCSLSNYGSTLCNKVTSCFNAAGGTTVTCSTGDYGCSTRIADGVENNAKTGACFGASVIPSTLSSSLYFKCYGWSNCNRVSYCWNLPGKVQVTCGSVTTGSITQYDYGCATSLTDGTGICFGKNNEFTSLYQSTSPQYRFCGGFYLGSYSWYFRNSNGNYYNNYGANYQQIYPCNTISNCWDQYNGYTLYYSCPNTIPLTYSTYTTNAVACQNTITYGVYVSTCSSSCTAGTFGASTVTCCYFNNCNQVSTNEATSSLKKFFSTKLFSLVGIFIFGLKNN